MKRNNLMYLLAGTGVGAAVGMLFAPRGGQEIRNTLTTRAQEGLDAISQKVDEGRRYVQESDLGRRAGETIRTAVERGKNVTSIGRERLNDSIEAGKAKYNEAIKPVPRNFSDEEDTDFDVSSF